MEVCSKNGCTNICNEYEKSGCYICDQCIDDYNEAKHHHISLTNFLHLPKSNNNLIPSIYSGNRNLQIELNDYYYNCADGCCTNIGTIVKVNDVELPLHNQDTQTIITQILEHLGFDVNVTSINLD